MYSEKLPKSYYGKECANPRSMHPNCDKPFICNVLQHRNGARIQACDCQFDTSRETLTERE